jgi:hypothetical protein
MNSPLPGAWRPAPQRSARAARPVRPARPVTGVLADGTPFFAPVGEVVRDGPLIVCHLCGRLWRSVTAHLRVHGWTKDAYCAAFGLERGQSLEGAETRKLRAAALASRLVFDAAFREGSAAGRRRARTGELARDAAAAARGRPHPEQRRRKARQALATIPAAMVAEANAQRARRHLAAVAADVARRHGYPSPGAFVLARTDEGASLAAISRAAGLHKDWLSRHLGAVDPVVAAAVARRQPAREDGRWQPRLARLGFPDVPSYLHARHVVQHRTVNVIADEAGLSHHAVESALRRHGLARTAHAAKRHAASQRAGQVAARLGHRSIADYVSQRRAAGWTWRAISAESGQPESWLRRHARNPGDCPAGSAESRAMPGSA